MSMRSFLKPAQVAEQFTEALDQDNFQRLRQLLDDECTYQIGAQELVGPDAIAESYEQNMIEGREALDELTWGQCGIEKVNENEFLLHFTDHLKHQGHSYIHRCQQRIVIGDEKTIVSIFHIENDEEQLKLEQFYRKVGLH